MPPVAQTETLSDLQSVVRRIASLRERRDDLIVQARREGSTLVSIASAADLSHPGVMHVLRRKAG